MVNREALEKILEKLPTPSSLVAVTKFVPTDIIEEAYELGLRDFGENRVQEFEKKIDQLPSDIRWHFIGHLQTNKVRDLVGKVYLIHSVDRVRLLNRINNEAKKNGVIVDVLLQLYIAQESSKQGFSPEEILEVIENRENYKSVRICGLMGMASFTDDMDQVDSEFAQVEELFNHIKENYPDLNEQFTQLSMGMSSDYEVALKRGSNLIRVGSTIFGDRE